MKKISGLENAHLDIYHHGARNTEETFMPLVEDFVQYLPELKPDVSGFFEPYRDPFDVEALRTSFINAPKGAMGVWDFDWRRKGKPKAWGGFKKMVWPVIGPQHAVQHFYVYLPSDLEVRVIEYMKHVCTTFPVDYAVFNWGLWEYESREQLQLLMAAGSDQVGLRTIDMVKHLPAIYWNQVFGAPYVRLFGLDKLLATPAFKVEQLGPEMVYVQLTETLFDVRERTAHVKAIRQQVVTHLDPDNNIIFNPNNPHDHVYQVPDFQFPEKPKP